MYFNIIKLCDYLQTITIIRLNHLKNSIIFFIKTLSKIKL